MRNTQPIHKAHMDPDGVLEVHHLFSTIQGEGPFSGHPAIFLRLYGCNLQCPMCDTDYTSKFQIMEPAMIVEKAKALCLGGEKLVVITGGEPLRQNIVPTAKALWKAGFHVQIETNGTLPAPEGCHELVKIGAMSIVCSPKTGSINKGVLPLIKAYKYVLKDGEAQADGLPKTALGHTANPALARPPTWFTGRIYVQPLDSADEQENKEHLEAAISSCRKHGHTLCLQTHKLSNLE